MSARTSCWQFTPLWRWDPSPIDCRPISRSSSSRATKKRRKFSIKETRRMTFSSVLTSDKWQSDLFARELLRQYLTSATYLHTSSALEYLPSRPPPPPHCSFYIRRFAPWENNFREWWAFDYVASRLNSKRHARRVVVPRRVVPPQETLYYVKT